jgi:hypothetical protein
MTSGCASSDVLETSDSDSPLAESRKSKFDLALHHPLMTASVLLPTPAVTDTFITVKRVVLLRETGCCFSGHSGVGKTSTLTMVKMLLHTQFPQLPIFRHDTHNQQIPSIRAFFKHFLSTVGHENKRGETYDLRERLVNTLIDDARISGMNMVLLFIDEAHAMATQDFNFLKDVYNDLAKESVQLITILIGQDPDLQHVISRLKSENRLDLIGRFAMRMLPFRSFNSIEDLQAVLGEIDKAEFPEGSGQSWSAFFFPQAYQAGFRLKNEAGAFMNALRSVTPKSPSATINFPARQAFVAIRAFCLDNARYDGAKIKLPDDAWKEAVEYARLKDAMLLVEGRKPQLSYEV